MCVNGGWQKKSKNKQKTHKKSEYLLILHDGLQSANCYASIDIERLILHFCYSTKVISIFFFFL